MNKISLKIVDVRYLLKRWPWRALDVKCKNVVFLIGTKKKNHSKRQKSLLEYFDNLLLSQEIRYDHSPDVFAERKIVNNRALRFSVLVEFETFIFIAFSILSKKYLFKYFYASSNLSSLLDLYRCILTEFKL